MLGLILGLFFLIMCLVFAGVVLRAIWGLLRIGWHYGPWAFALACIVVGLWCWPRDKVGDDGSDAAPNSAASYRAAQRAVERATGAPCDYACKVMIADQARPKPVDN